jgi:two-component system OmpR family sensor kinase
VVAVLLSATVVRDALALAAAQEVLTLMAAAVGAASAILTVVASRMLGEPRLAWVAAALVLYCAVVLPWTTAAPTEFDLSQRASRLVAYLAALLLLVLSCVRRGHWGRRAPG